MRLISCTLTRVARPTPRLQKLFPIKLLNISCRESNRMFSSSILRRDRVYPCSSFSQTIRLQSSNIRVGQVPSMGESITEGVLSSWEKNIGDFVKQNELLAVIDTDKVSVDIHPIADGCLVEQKAKAGDAVLVGQDLYSIDIEAKNKHFEFSEETTGITSTNDVSLGCNTQNFSKAMRPKESNQNTPKHEIITEKTSVPEHSDSVDGNFSEPLNKTSFQEDPEMKTDKKIKASPDFGERKETAVRMTRLRKTIANRLKTAQNAAASLTTFNECDMTRVIAMRSELQEEFTKKYGLKLGFVSIFLYAASRALLRFPEINAYISMNGDEIIYKNYVDISVAVSTPSGLLVPVLRDCHKKSIPDLETDLYQFAQKARDGRIALDEMTGGSFTISNGGIFGSLMGTPILNHPQSSILGLHAIKQRPVVFHNEIVSRPMMYLALTYDHRLVDGREAVTFLNTIKNSIEDPRRLLLDL